MYKTMFKQGLKSRSYELSFIHVITNGTKCFFPFLEVLM